MSLGEFWAAVMAAFLFGALLSLGGVLLGATLVYRVMQKGSALFARESQGSIRSLETDDDEPIAPIREHRSVLDTEQEDPNYPADIDQLLRRNAQFMDQMAVDKAIGFETEKVSYAS